MNAHTHIHNIHSMDTYIEGHHITYYLIINIINLGHFQTCITTTHKLPWRPTFSLYSCVCWSTYPSVVRGPSPNRRSASSSTSASRTVSNWRKWTMLSKRRSCFSAMESRRPWRSTEEGWSGVREDCTTE